MIEVFREEQSPEADWVEAELRELEKFAAQWRMFEGDWCYVDEEGETC